MKITIENYEAFFLDYHEGNLSKQQVVELMDFLEVHPELREEFESFELLNLDDNNLPSFTFKESLKKEENPTTITRENFEEYSIALWEGDLDVRQQEEFHAFLTIHPELKKVHKLYAQARLAENEKSIFPSKHALKRTEDTILDGLTLEQALVAYHEGDLNDQQKESILTLVASNAEVATDFFLLKKTQLQADTEIIFPEKKLLYRHIFIPNTRNFWYYGSVAAAVVLFLFSLLFLLPQPEQSQLADGNSGLITREPEPQPLPEVRPDTVTTTKDTLAPTEEKIAPPETTPEATEEKPKPFRPFILYESVYVAQMTPITHNPLAITAASHIEQIEKRTEFEYWSMRDPDFYTFDEDEDELPVTPQPRRETSFASLAYSEIERTTGIGIRKIEDRVGNNTISIWDIAGVGLAGISQLTGTPLTVDKDRDEQGRITTFAIGDRFRFSR